MASAQDRDELSKILEYAKGTKEQDWCTDVVRNKDGANCLFGHISEMEGTEYAEGEMWEWFEDTWGTTYYVYPINDGQNPKYPQATPKQRIVAYLEALLSGEEQDMETYWNSMAELM